MREYVKRILALKKRELTPRKTRVFKKFFFETFDFVENELQSFICIALRPPLILRLKIIKNLFNGFHFFAYIELGEMHSSLISLAEEVKVKVIFCSQKNNFFPLLSQLQDFFCDKKLYEYRLAKT